MAPPVTAASAGAANPAAPPSIEANSEPAKKKALPPAPVGWSNPFVVPPPVASPPVFGFNESRFRGRLWLWRSPDEIKLGKYQSSGHINPIVNLIPALDAIAGPDEKAMADFPMLLKRLKDKDPELRWRAAYRLGKIRGPTEAAIPTLEAALKDPSPKVREEAAIALVRISKGDVEKSGAAVPVLIDALKGSSADVKLRAMEAIGFLSESSAKLAVPALLALLQDADGRIRIEAAILLSYMSYPGGPNAQKNEEILSSLMAGIQDTDKDIRLRSAEAIAFLGPAAWRAVPDLQAALKKETIAYVREKYLKALRAIGPHFPEVIPTLISLLQDADERVRAMAIVSLGDYGGRAKDAVPELFKLVSGLHGRIMNDLSNYAISTVIAKIASQDRSVVPQVVAALQSSNWRTQMGALFTLEQIEPPVKEAVPLLIDLLKKTDSNGILPSWIMAALEKMGPEAKAAISVLETYLDSYDVRSAADALGAMGAEARSSLPQLEAALEKKPKGDWFYTCDRRHLAKAIGRIADPNSPQAELASETLAEILLTDKNFRQFAAQALGEIGPSAKTAVPALVSALEDKDPEVRWSTLAALEKIGPEAKAAIPALTAILFRTDASVGVKQGVVEVLKAMGEGAGEAFPELLKLLKDKDPALRSAAANALKVLAYQMKNKNEKIKAALTAALDDTELAVRKEAISIVSHLPWVDPSFVPALRKNLGDADPVLRLQSLRILKQLGPEAKEAVSDLILRLEDENPIIQAETVRTLGAVGPAAKEAIPRLKELLTKMNRRDPLARALREALRQIQA